MGLLADQAISGLVKRDGASRRLTFERINYSPALTPALVATASFKDAPLGLIDVGASGGIEAHWRAFAGALRAWGFDCLVEEVNRLNASTPSPDVVYYAKFVSYKGYQSLFSDSSSADRCVRNNSPFSRTSSVRAQQLMGWNHVSRMYDPVGHGKLTTETIELDDFFERVTDQIDFIKIDTDGHDYPVLLGAERLLREKFILGVCVESQFHGPVHDHANLFCNIDRFMRQRGFSLFDLDVYRYSRAALPRPFVYNIPANTTTGQVIWGDALYLRDLGQANYETEWSVEIEEAKILKLACLFELHGLEDCAAELLLKYRSRLSSRINVDECLNLLTSRAPGFPASFTDYNLLFDKNIQCFFPAAANEQSGVKQRSVSLVHRILKSLVDRGRLE